MSKFLILTIVFVSFSSFADDTSQRRFFSHSQEPLQYDPADDERLLQQAAQDRNYADAFACATRLLQFYASQGNQEEANRYREKLLIIQHRSNLYQAERTGNYQVAMEEAAFLRDYLLQLGDIGVAAWYEQRYLVNTILLRFVDAIHRGQVDLALVEIRNLLQYRDLINEPNTRLMVQEFHREGHGAILQRHILAHHVRQLFPDAVGFVERAEQEINQDFVRRRAQARGPDDLWNIADLYRRIGRNGEAAQVDLVAQQMVTMPIVEEFERLTLQVTALEELQMLREQEAEERVQAQVQETLQTILGVALGVFQFLLAPQSGRSL